MRKVLELIYRGLVGSGVFLFLGMTTVVCVNIVGRYFFDYSFSWSEEVARYMMIWMTMIGAAMAIRKWSHFRLEFFEHVFGGRARSFFRSLALACVLFVGLLLVWQGVIWLPITNHQLATATQVPMSWIYASLPLAGVLMILFALEAAYDELRQRSGADADSKHSH